MRFCKPRCLIFVFASIFLSALLSGCNTTVSVKVQDDLSGDFSLQTAVSPSVKAISESFLGNEPGTSLFDTVQIRSSLEKANLTVTQIASPVASSLTVTAKTPNVCTAVPNADDFITVKTAGNVSRMTVKLTPQNVRKVLSLMSDETALLVDLLIAPVFTGEVLTKEEYAEIIAISYGTQIATELQAATINLSFALPSAVTDAKLSNPAMGTVSASGKNVRISLPLINFLTDLNGTECIIERKI